MWNVFESHFRHSVTHLRPTLSLQTMSESTYLFLWNGLVVFGFPHVVLELECEVKLTSPQTYPKVLVSTRSGKWPTLYEESAPH